MIIEIIDNTPDFVVINKPENISFHDEGDIKSGLFSQLKDQLNISTLYPVHRLDKITSGLLIFSKNINTTQTLQQAFEEHKIQKYYLAISDKKPKKKQGLVKGDMGKSRRRSWKLLHTLNNPAISQFFSLSIGNGKRLFLIKPHSGKTHQIRVALNSLGSPILGDDIYSSSPADRGYLHAYGLSFEIKGVYYNYLCEPKTGAWFTQKETQEQLKQWKEPANLSWPQIK